MFMKNLVLAMGCSALLVGCDGQPDATQEIVDNLVEAGFPASDIMVVDGKVYVGQDAQVSLAASREMLVQGSTTEEQYRTTNLVSRSLTKICVDGSAFVGDFSTALDRAIQNYDELTLTFGMARAPSTGCSFTINAVIDMGLNGGVAGFPANGQPFGQITIGGQLSQYGVDVIEHVITHELGHTLGLRHSDYYDRSISCGDAGNEGAADVGAIHIPGTPTGATSGGSLMNSCFRPVETGEFAPADITALWTLYPQDTVFNDHGVAPLDSSWSGFKVHAVGDFNGDGRTDLYLNYDNLGAGGNQHIWYGRSDGGFNDHVVASLDSSWSGFKVHAVGDFNGDGRTDLYLNHDNPGAGGNQHIWYGRSDGGFNDHFMAPLDSSWSGFKVHAVGDFNGDGRTDLYVNHNNLGAGGNQHIWYGRTGTGFNGHYIAPLDSSWTGFKVHAVGDFNGDGKTDVYLNHDNLGAGGNQHLWYGRAGTGFNGHGIAPLDSSWIGFKVHAVGDFNGDGKTDLYLNHSNLGAGGHQHFWYGRTTGGFDGHGVAPMDSSWSGFKVHAVGDFNGDGRTELYLNHDNLGAGGSPHIWSGRTDRGFNDHREPTLDSSWNGFKVHAVGDFNGDGKTDLYLNHNNLGAGGSQHIWYGRLP
ncbi:M57 family metalloprotease [Myxococcus stipitatus]|nr:M57 family metalloprotease [Myxococcus stipitatus]